MFQRTLAERMVLFTVTLTEWGPADSKSAE